MTYSLAPRGLSAATATAAACLCLIGGAPHTTWARASSPADDSAPFLQGSDSAQTVSVVASREPLPLAQQVADVRVFSRDQLQALPADNLADALQILVGAQVSRTGGSGQPTSVLIRGASAPNTLVLVDGVRMGSATLGQFDFAGLALAGIERIEVLRGPGATLHGADAVGGVVLVTTRSPRATSLTTASVAAGSHGTHEGNLRVRRGGETWEGQLQVSSEASSGVSAVRPGDRFGLYNPDADGFQRRSMALGGGWAPTAGHRLEATVLVSRLFSRYDSAAYLPPTYAPDASPDFATRTTAQASSISYELPLAATVRIRLSGGSGAEDSRSGAIDIDRYQTARRQAGLQLGWQVHADHRWTLAWDSLHEDVQASGYVGPVSRENDALVLAYAGRWGDMHIQADGRQDRNSVYGHHESGRTGLKWALDPRTSLRVQAASTFRAPSFNDLYFPGYGVVTLKPEEGRSLELGLSSGFVGLQWDATAWRQSVRNLIAYSADRRRCPTAAVYDFGCAANIGQAELRGLTVELGPAGFGAGPARAAPSTTAWSLGYDLTDARDGQGQPLPRRARHQLRAHGQTLMAGWRLGSSLLWQSTRREGSVALKGGTKIDLQAQRTLVAGWTLQARLLNALDADIEPARDYRAPGRQVWLGVRWEGR